MAIVVGYRNVGAATKTNACLCVGLSYACAIDKIAVNLLSVAGALDNVDDDDNVEECACVMVTCAYECVKSEIRETVSTARVRTRKTKQAYAKILR